MIARAVSQRGFRALCCREVQRSLEQSAKALLTAKITTHGLASQFEVQERVIKTPGGGRIDFIGLRDHTADSIKSYEGYDVAWVEEAQSIRERSLQVLRPTIRAPGSELWFSWNPRNAMDAVDRLFRDGEPPTGAIVVRANWSDNPWFPEELNAERVDAARNDADHYGHIWEGDHATVVTGAYYADVLRAARAEGRVGRVAADPLMERRAFWDIGISDACSIWVAQFVGREVRVLDYYEATGQPLAAHLAWLRERHPGVRCFLPHDGAQRDAVTGDRFVDHVRAGGFAADVVPNAGKGAALKRVEAVRRLFPAMWFNEATCVDGLAALGAYHKKLDDVRGTDLGPEHDWASHGADAAGLMAMAYEVPRTNAARTMDLSNLRRAVA